ncbi:peptidoglycan-binding domain-containing protein [Cryobacterium sp. PH31-AA6]|uniref:peptidoglycan-binding domain-containing protein n=1 Tax=Cryobacterium sp. PH31-AA6 TaxID=3046205 RepID=UPI0024B88EFA|nr:peptidoglycan-binding domain-containing protein [Cryobacterium sp. PH31-AA6]MDJ0325504.1 peptidoglycan-binding domain-containing protein [Cryobacterium sp. PH31-AA6]
MSTVRTNGVWRWVIAGTFLLAVGAATGWAATTVLAPPTRALEARKFTTVEVAQGEVGSSLSLNTASVWTFSPIGTNQAVGIITSIAIKPGEDVDQGSTLYTVGLRPVVVARGDVPAFRAIADGSIGADVGQLQTMLSDLGYYSGVADGKAGAYTSAAIKKWQKSLGLEESGTVEPGDVIFVPSLPTRVALDGGVIKRGATLAGGESVVQGLPPSPTFSVPVTDAQAVSMPAGTRVEITGPDGSLWESLVVAHVKDATTGSTNAILAGLDGLSICRDQCGLVPVSGQSLLPSKVVTVETVKGLSVPSAALITTPDGSVAVVDKAGSLHPVTIIASARGISLIEGVREGLHVRLPSTTGPS